MLCIFGAYDIFRDFPWHSGSQGGVTLHKNKVLLWSAILIWVFEFSKYVVSVCCYDWERLLQYLPFFLCSLQLFALPLVCCTKGSFQKAMADCTLIWGMIAAITGTVLSTAMNYHGPFSFFPLNSVITHCISGFACLYIGCAKLYTLNWKTLVINLSSLFVFSLMAWGMCKITPQTYMFLTDPSGTPFQILYDLFNGSEIWYPISVIFVQLLYVVLFYGVVYLVRHIFRKHEVGELENPAKDTPVLEDAEMTEDVVSKSNETEDF